MTAPPNAKPLDMLTAALGGRRVYMFLWMFWLFAAAIGHYLQEFAKKESIQWHTKLAFAVCVLGLIAYSALLCSSLASREKRNDLWQIQTGLPQVGDSFRALVWIVPIVAFGALISPVLPW